MAHHDDQPISRPNGLPLVRLETGSGWRGWAVAPCRHFEFNALPWRTLRHRDQSADGVTCIKISRSRHVLRLDRPRDFGVNLDRPVYVKRYLINSLRRRVGNLLSGGKAAREFRLGWKLLSRGLRTAEPLAFAIAMPGRILKRPWAEGYAPAASLLLTLGVESQGMVRDWAKDGRARRTPLFYPTLAAFLARMHAMGFHHDDCSAGNICVAPETTFETRGDDPLQSFLVIDIDHGRLGRGPVSPRGRAHNLFQVIRSLRASDMDAPEERCRFVESYLEAAELDPQTHMDLFARRIDRLARRKLGGPLMT